MVNIHLISFTPLDAPGGVPRWNRYVKRILEEDGYAVKHWCWFDVMPEYYSQYDYLAEYDKAKLLSRVLHADKCVDRGDIIIADGFWCGDFVAMGYKRVISVAHGIWGHVTKDDIDAGVVPENLDLHMQQIKHRLLHQHAGLPIVAVSMFINEQMKLQNGINSIVINNAIDEKEINKVNITRSGKLRDTIIVHGVNDKGNVNKGWDHISAVTNYCSKLGISVYSLDELYSLFNFKSKLEAMQIADYAIIPSGYEGNSYFALELMECGIPLAAYDVGIFCEMSRKNMKSCTIMERRKRSVNETINGLTEMLSKGYQPFVRDELHEVITFEKFKNSWLDVVRSI